MTTEIISDVFKCECCNEDKYSIEFADSDLFVNGKVPVCATCARSTSQRANEVIRDLSIPDDKDT